MTIEELKILITANTDSLRNELNDTRAQLKLLEKTTLKSNSGMLSSFSILKNGMKALGLGAIFYGLGKTILSSTDAAISRVDTMNNFSKVMSTLGISSDLSKASIDRLGKSLIGLPTTLDSAALSVQRLTSANGNIEASTEMFLAMNNAILAGGANMQLQASAIEQLSQAYAKGKPDIMEWRALLQAMPAQLKQLSVAMGYASTEQLGEALRSGAISMNEFMVKMIELNKNSVKGFKSFEEQARNSTGGIRTSMANIRTAITRGVAEIINAIGQANITNFFQGIINAINATIPYVVAFARVVTSVFGTIASFLGGKKENNQAKEIDNSSKALEKVKLSGISAGKGIDKATGAAKKLNKALKGLASFDEMNVLIERPRAVSGGGVAASDVGDGGNFDFDIGKIDSGLNGVKDKTKEIEERIRNFINDFGSKINFDNIKREFDKLLKALEPLKENLFSGLKFFYDEILEPIALWTINDAIPTFLDLLASAINYVNKSIEFLKPYAMFLFDNFLKPLGEFVAAGIIGTFRGIAGAINKIIETKTGLMLLTGVFGKLLSVLILKIPKVKKALEPLRKQIDIWNEQLLYSPRFGKIWINTMDRILKINRDVADTLKYPITSIQIFASDVRNQFKKVKKTFEDLFTTTADNSKNWRNRLNASFTGIKDSFKSMIENTKSMSKSGTSFMGGVWNGFKDMLGNVWGSVVDFTKGAMDKLVATIATNPLGALITAFTILVSKSEGLQNVIKALGEAIQPIFDILGDLLVAVLKPLEPILGLIAKGIELILKPVVWLADLLGGVITKILELFGIEINSELEENLEEKAEATKALTDKNRELADSLREQAEQYKNVEGALGFLYEEYIKGAETIESYNTKISDAVRSAQDAGNANKVLTEKQEDLTQSIKDSIDARKDLIETERDFADQALAVMDAEDRLKEKQEKLIEVGEKYGKNSREYKRAKLEVESATNRLTRAEEKQEETINKLNASQETLAQKNVKVEQSTADLQTQIYGFSGETDKASEVLATLADVQERGNKTAEEWVDKNINKPGTAYSEFTKNMKRNTKTIEEGMKSSTKNMSIDARKKTKDITESFTYLFKDVEKNYNRTMGKIGKSSIDLKNASTGELIDSYYFDMYIPKYAKGGIIDKPTFAMIGEQGREAVVPLERNTEWIDILTDKLGKVNGDTDVYVYIDSDKVADSFIKKKNRKAFQTNGGVI